MSFAEINSLLASSGVTAAKFASPGDTVTGTIADAREEQQRDFSTGKPKFWDDGSPMNQIVIYLDTTLRDASVQGDDGRRAVYCRGQMLSALRTAVRAAGAPLDQGGTLTVTYTGNGERTKAGYNPPKIYQVAYRPPAPAGMAAVNESLAAPQAAAAVTRPPSVPAAVWDTLDADQRAALAAVSAPF